MAEGGPETGAAWAVPGKTIAEHVDKGAQSKWDGTRQSRVHVHDEQEEEPGRTTKRLGSSTGRPPHIETGPGKWPQRACNKTRVSRPPHGKGRRIKRACYKVKGETGTNRERESIACRRSSVSPLPPKDDNQRWVEAPRTVRAAT